MQTQHPVRAKPMISLGGSLVIATDRAIQSIPAYPAEQFQVEIGANMGDTLGVLDELMLDDIYQLSPPAQPQRLALASRSDGSFYVAENTDLGTIGAQLHLDCCLTLMPQSGDNIEALVMVEVDNAGLIAAIYLLPMAPLSIQQSYTLVRAEQQPARRKLAQMACVSFTRGTRITMATGAQKPIEDLRPGDRILTRDEGVQQLRWIGESTSRAVGRMAPVLIRAGALNNAADLLVSPDHRLLVYNAMTSWAPAAPSCWCERGIWSTVTQSWCRTAALSTIFSCCLTATISSTPKALPQNRCFLTP